MRKLSTAIVVSIFSVLLIAIFFSYAKESHKPKQVKSHSGYVKSATTSTNESATYLVTRIVDGDTFVIDTGQKVRYIGINAPELHVLTTKIPDCYGLEAKAKDSELILGKRVTLIKDVSETDKYGRLLRYVYVGDDFINRDLVEQGFAQIDTFPPDVKYKSVFLKAQKDARENKRGLWGSC